MSFKAGDLNTTYRADYVPPALMPKYGGECQTVHYGIGSTYGGATKKYFEDYRNEVLTRNRKPEFYYGKIPTPYNPLPDVAYAERIKNLPRLIQTPNYQLSRADKARMNEISDFHELASKHKIYYKDRTGTIPRVNYFVVPPSFTDQSKKWRREVKSLVTAQVLHAKERGELFFPDSKAIMPPQKFKPAGHFRPTCDCVEDTTPSRFWPPYQNKPVRTLDYGCSLGNCNCPLKMKKPECKCVTSCNRYCFLKNMAPRPRYWETPEPVCPRGILD